MSNPPFSIITSQAPILTPRDTTRAIIREVAERHGVWLSDLLNTACRDAEMALVRRKAIIAIHRAKPQMSCRAIAEEMRCDHKVVWNAISGRGAASLTQDAAE